MRTRTRTARCPQCRAHDQVRASALLVVCGRCGVVRRRLPLQPWPGIVRCGLGWIAGLSGTMVVLVAAGFPMPPGVQLAVLGVLGVLAVFTIRLYRIAELKDDSLRAMTKRFSEQLGADDERSQ